MPSKDFYREIAAYAEQKLTISVSEWTSFLATVSRLYKYPYHDQVMIHAQRPNATACAEYDVWNKKMGRFIRKGAKGIALLDDTQGKTKLRYVFDVSDTVIINEKSKAPWIWELEDKHIGPVMAMLERTYGIGGSEFESQIDGVARKMADEYWADHQDEILRIVDDSLLEEYDEFNIGVRFKTAATVSIAYCIMLRCGLKPEEYFDHQDFLSIFDFDTKQTIGALGTAISQINQQVLRQISDKIRQADREAIQERRALYERDQIHSGGRSAASRFETDRPGGYATGQIRQDAKSIPEGTSAHQLQPHGAGRDTVSSSEGDRPDGQRTTGADDATAGEGSGSDRAAEGQRPHEVGGADAHLQGPGRGDSEGGADFRLISASEEKADSGKLPAFSDEKQIMAIIANKNDDLKFTQKQIGLFFDVHTDQQERADYLKSAYQDRYTEIIVDGQRLGYKPQEDGLLIWEGSYLSRTKESVYSWHQVAEWTAQLLGEEKATPIIGRIFYAYYPMEEYTDVDSYLKAICEELPYMATTGMRFKTLTKDPEIRKAVDDIVYDFNGERSPHPLAYYRADGQKAPKKEGKAKER